MAENITTLLEKPDAENVQGSDYLYLVQGSGSKRDRKIKLEALFASDPAHTLLVDEQDTVKKRYLAPAFFRGSDSGYFDIFFSASDITRDGAKVRVIGAFIGIEKVTTNKLANASVTKDKLADDAVTNAKIASHAVSNGSLADNSVSTDKIIDGSVTPEKIDETGDYTVKSMTATGSVDADSLRVTKGAIIGGDTGVNGNLTVLSSKKLTAAGEVDLGYTKTRTLTLGVSTPGVGSDKYYSVFKADSKFDMTMRFTDGEEGEIKIVLNTNNQYPIDVTCTSGTITIPVHGAHMFIGMGSSIWYSID